jgi:uncharacterized protein YjbI with pentapeptide repeats
MHTARATPFERVLTGQEKQELQQAVFRNRELVGIDLTHADLRGACFEGVILDRCDLTGADLRGARFILCELRDVVMAETQLGETRFDGTMLQGVVGLSESERLAVVRGGGVEQPPHASQR